MLILKYVELESKIQLLFFYDIIIIHFLISDLIHTCCALAWYWDIQCFGPVSLGTGPVTPNAGSVTLYTFPVLTISVRYYGVYYRYQLYFFMVALADWCFHTNNYSNWSTFRILCWGPPAPDWVI
jgi:hypothetical protein